MHGYIHLGPSVAMIANGTILLSLEQKFLSTQESTSSRHIECKLENQYTLSRVLSDDLDGKNTVWDPAYWVLGKSFKGAESI